jgi:hypothetical protein
VSAPDLMTLLGAAAEDVGEKLEAADRLAMGYVRAYTEWYVKSGSQHRAGQPSRPAGLDEHIAKAIRESVLEQATVARMGRPA